MGAEEAVTALGPLDDQGSLSLGGGACFHDSFRTVALSQVPKFGRPGRWKGGHTRTQTWTR